MAPRMCLSIAKHFSPSDEREFWDASNRRDSALHRVVARVENDDARAMLVSARTGRRRIEMGNETPETLMRAQAISILSKHRRLAS